jgi:predicted nucleic acid-binding protein
VAGERVLVDTSAWIDFFRDRRPLADTVERLLAEGRAVHCGPIELELRRGLRGHEVPRVIPVLWALEALPCDAVDFASAGDLLRGLRTRGITLPSMDGLIATLALRHEVPLLTSDRDFDAVPGLRRMDADGSLRST